VRLGGCDPARAGRATVPVNDGRAGPAEAELARLTAATAARRAATAGDADRLLERVDWGVLARMLTVRRLLPLLGERIVELAGERAPPSFVDATREAIDACAEHDCLLELLSIQVIHALEAAGVPALSLKGPALGRALYGQPGRRPSADIDVLVRTEDLPAAVDIAERLGYRDPEPPRPGAPMPLLHRRLVHRQPSLPVLELHWRVHWYEQLFSRDMLLRSSPGGLSGPRPRADDEFTSLLLFYARDGFVDLRLACDLAAWWDALGPQLPAGAVAAQIARYPALGRVLVAAAAVGDHVVGVPGLALLGEAPEVEPRVGLAIRLANPDALGARTQHQADALLIDLLLTPPGGRRESIRRQLRTPRGAQPGHTPTTRDGASASINHGLRLLRRHALGLRRVARDRATVGRYRVTSRP
jgi:Uncharacterised nucleotidyltransferase